MINSQSQCLRVSTLSYYLIGGLSAPFCWFLGVMQWMDRNILTPELSVSLFIMSVVAVVLCLMGGTIELTNDSIRTFTPLGSYELTWAEISGFTFEPYHNSLFLFAKNKQLYVPAPRIWSGRDKDQAKMFLIEQLELHQTPVVKGPLFLIFSHNCKLLKSVDD